MTGAITTTNVTFSIGGVPIAELAERYGTPLYVYDADGVRRHVMRIRSGLRRLDYQLLFSAKANPLPALVSTLRREGLGLDVCSPGDLRLAELAGYSRAGLSYTGFGPTDAELALAAEKAGSVTVDHPNELDRLPPLDERAEIGLRLNLDVNGGLERHGAAGAADAKFGLPAHQLASAVGHACRRGIAIRGLHVHLGSEILETTTHLRALERLARLSQYCPDISWINLGGGWGTPDRGGDTYDWRFFGRHAAQILRTASRPLQLRLEPGGHLTLDTGWLLTRVTDVRAAAGRRPRTLIVDANTNQAVSVLLYGAHHAAHSARPGAAVENYRIVGNLLNTADVFAERTRLPKSRVGDILALGMLGAYASCRSSNFNQRLRPAEVLVSGGAARLARRAETVDDLYQRDMLQD